MNWGLALGQFNADTDCHYRANKHGGKLLPALIAAYVRGNDWNSGCS